MKTLVLAALMSASASMALAADKYALDPSHSQVVFHWEHLGFSTTYGMFSGFDGEIMFDQENPANSSVTVSMPTTSMFTGWEERTGHFMTDDFFGATDEDMITFNSTSIEVTGDDTAKITGDLTLNDVTKSVVLDATLNQAANNPMANKLWAGFDATTTLLRTDYNLGKFAPHISDEVQVMISVEAGKVD